MAALRYEQMRRLTPTDLQRVAARVLVPQGGHVLWVSTTRSDAPTPRENGTPRPGMSSSEGGR